LGGSSAVRIYTQTVHRTTQSTQKIHRTKHFTNLEECGPCPVFARYTLAFAFQLRKKHGKTSATLQGHAQTEAQNLLHLSRNVLIITVPLINDGQHQILNHIHISLLYFPVIL